MHTLQDFFRAIEKENSILKAKYMDNFHLDVGEGDEQKSEDGVKLRLGGGNAVLGEGRKKKQRERGSDAGSVMSFESIYEDLNGSGNPFASRSYYRDETHSVDSKSSISRSVNKSRGNGRSRRFESADKFYNNKRNPLSPPRTTLKSSSQGKQSQPPFSSEKV
jgi:hypothetical protein